MTDMTFCAQCTMKAILAGRPSPSFNETPAQHLRRVHPDAVATQRERAELEERFRQMAEEIRNMRLETQERERRSRKKGLD
jgi:hypothetical protein